MTKHLHGRLWVNDGGEGGVARQLRCDTKKPCKTRKPHLFKVFSCRKGRGPRAEGGRPMTVRTVSVLRVCGRI